MKKYFIVLLSLLLCSVSIHSKTAVVLDFDTEIKDFEHNAVIMSDMLRSELVNTKKLDVIDRKSMDIAIGEMRSQASDYRSNKNVKQLGQMLNADYIIIGVVSLLSNTGASANGFFSQIGKVVTGKDKIEVIVRILDVETLKVLSSSSTELENWTDFSKHVKKIALDLVGNHALSSEVSTNIKNAKESMLYGIWEGEIVHNGIIDKYTISFGQKHKVAIDVVSGENTAKETRAKGVGRFTFNDSEKILAITINSLSGDIQHLKSINWKSFVNPSQDDLSFSYIIPETSTNGSSKVKITFYKEE